MADEHNIATVGLRASSNEDVEVVKNFTPEELVPSVVPPKVSRLKRCAWFRGDDRAMVNPIDMVEDRSGDAELMRKLKPVGAKVSICMSGFLMD